jgi:hypothetical protein
MTWLAEQGTYLSGQEAIDSLDLVAIECERRWGCDRLRLLVPEDLRTKFDRQRLLTDAAITRGDLDDVLRETKRMISAWRALDKVASSNPQAMLPPTVWETPGPDGCVIQIVKEGEQAGMVAAQNVANGRRVQVYTLEEVGRILANLPSLYKIKETFPGATIVAVRQSVADPLNHMPVE